MTGGVLAPLTAAERGELAGRLVNGIIATARLAVWSAPSAELWSHAKAVQIELAELHGELCDAPIREEVAP